MPISSNICFRLELFKRRIIMPCDLFGCPYNEDGACGYNKASIKIREARACYEEDIEAELDALAGNTF